MKYTISAEFEDRAELKNFAHLDDILIAHWDAMSLIRTRLKHEIHDDGDEAKFLERLRSALYVPGIDE